MKTESFQINTIFFLLIAVFSSCKVPSSETTSEEVPSNAIVYNNTPAEGFDIEGSNPIAVLLADQVMNAMGGRKKWDETNVLHWNFFGGRTLLWDKKNNWVRIDVKKDSTVYTLNMNDDTGKVWKGGIEMTDEIALTGALKKAKNMWINDSYWLVMPFKLKDSGVTLNYLREEATLTGESCDVIWVTFKETGKTPENGYEVWISIDTRLVKQWAYFKNAEDQEPAFVRPWDGYVDYDGLLLSSERGKRDLSDIKVLDEVPKGAFDNADPITFK